MAGRDYLKIRVMQVGSGEIKEIVRNDDGFLPSTADLHFSDFKYYFAGTLQPNIVLRMSNILTQSQNSLKVKENTQNNT